MTKCSYCGKEISGLSFRCHRCSREYCAEHHLPEDHNCPGLKKEKEKNSKKWQETIKSNFEVKNRYIKKRQNPTKNKKINITSKSNELQRKMRNIKVNKSEIINIFSNITKWAFISFIGLLISRYIIIKLTIINDFLGILLAAIIISILIQAVRSHNNQSYFKMKWFIFYFLIYSIIIWIIGYMFPKLSFQNGILPSIIIGFAIGIFIYLIQETGIKSRTVPWISLVLVLILIVSNLGYLQGIIPINFQNLYKNSSLLQESEQLCPTPTKDLQEFETSFNPKIIASTLNNDFIDISVWRVENLFSSCYKGKYKGQYPNSYYCDNMIVSRWETGSSGEINYRWYTAVTAELNPTKLENGVVIYSLNAFSCENGQKVTVKKGVTDYYVYDSKDGTKIRIKY